MDYPYNWDIPVSRVKDWLEFEEFVNQEKWKRKCSYATR
jgi:hypothetical protein